MAIPLTKNLSCALIMMGFIMSAGICSAQLTGTAELSYTTYNAKEDEQEIKATSLLQRYSLLYKTSGVLVDNRLGRYKVALGYEWAGLDANIKQIKDGDVDKESMRPKQAGHLLYEGEIVMDPKELPFRFRAYSRDLRETTFQNDTAEFLRGGDAVIIPEMPTNIIGGVHMLSGATLVLGVKNGMTNGYNTVFKDIPMLLFDYRDEIHRDRDSQTPTDSRLKKLAFVSLNKKDNWFHYRTTLFTDKINTDSSYKETQIQIGTIDQYLVRRWIDMTNWIKISVDGQFTKRNDYTTNGNEELYELNLFGIANRRLWEAKMYNYFGRKVDNNGPLYERRIPVYARGNVGLDTEWNLRTSYEDWQRVSGDNKEDRITMMASLRVDTLKRAPFTLSNTIQVERHKANATNYLAIEEMIETSSTRRFSDKISLYGSYDIRMFVNDTYSLQPDPADLSGVGTINVPTQEKYVRQALRARAVYRPENRLKTELEVLVDRTDGNPGSAFTQVGDANAKGGSFTHGGSSGEYSRYSVTSRTDWEPLPRFKLAAVVSEDVLYEKDVPGDYLSIFGISADYTVSNLVARAEMRYTLRTGGVAGDGSSFEQSARVQYTHDRSLDAGLSYRLSRVSEETAADREDVTLTQTLNYYLYSSQGVTRRWIEVNQLAEYYKDSVEIKKTASIGLRYNPTRQLFISARTKYTFLNRAGTSEREAVYSATAGMNFQKLQVALDYSYGRRDGDDKRIDKRLSMNVRKIF